jgi:hypothetical protein
MHAYICCSSGLERDEEMQQVPETGGSLHCHAGGATVITISFLSIARSVNFCASFVS